jgi:hypothetical protein
MKTFALLLTAAALVFPGVANAAGIVYVTGSDPWENTTNDSAMNAAFGAGNWTKVLGFADSVFTSGYDFIFMDGGDANGTAFGNYFNSTGAAAATSYVTSGGRLFLNAAYNSGPTVTNTGAGTQLLYGDYFSNNNIQITAAGLAAGLGTGLTGTAFTGSSFTHNAVLGSLIPLIVGETGTALAGGQVGAGYFLLGGQTTTNFHVGVGDNDPFNLRVNQLNLAANADLNGGVPEPATWAMMIAGFGLVGGAMRRRNTSVRVTYA